MMHNLYNIYVYIYIYIYYVYSNIVYNIIIIITTIIVITIITTICFVVLIATNFFLSFCSNASVVGGSVLSSGAFESLGLAILRDHASIRACDMFFFMQL